MKNNQQIIPKKGKLIVNHKKTDYLLYRINQRIEKVFANQKMKHKTIYSLVNECNNWIPTKFEVRAYEQLRQHFNDLFYTLNIR